MGAGTGTGWAGTGGYWPIVDAGGEGAEPAAAKAAWLLVERSALETVKAKTDVKC